MMSIEKGDTELAKFLIDNSANVNAVSMSKNCPNETALSKAAKAQSKPLVGLLVERSAEIQVNILIIST